MKITTSFNDIIYQIQYLEPKGLEFSSLGDMATFIFYGVSLIVILVSFIINNMIFDISDKFGIDKKKLYLETLTITIFDTIYLVMIASIVPYFLLFRQIEISIYNLPIINFILILVYLVFFIFLFFFVQINIKSIVSNKYNKYFMDIYKKNLIKNIIIMLTINFVYFILITWIDKKNYLIYFTTLSLIMTFYLYIQYLKKKLYFNNSHLFFSIIMKYTQIFIALSAFMYIKIWFKIDIRIIRIAVENKDFMDSFTSILNIICLIMGMFIYYIIWLFLLSNRYRDLMCVKKYRVYLNSEVRNVQYYIANNISEVNDFIILDEPEIKTKNINESNLYDEKKPAHNKSNFVTTKKIKINQYIRKYGNNKKKNNINKITKIVTNTEMEINNNNILKKKDDCKKIYLNKNAIQKIEFEYED